MNMKELKSIQTPKDSIYKHMLNFDPWTWPHLWPRVMIWTNLNPH